MAADKILLEVATPEKLVLSEEVDFVTAPGGLGEFTVLPGHTPLLTIIEPGLFKCGTYGENPKVFAVGWGYAEVRPYKMIVLVEFAETADEIDKEEVEREVRDLVQKVFSSEVSPEEREAYRKQLERMRARLKLVSS